MADAEPRFLTRPDGHRLAFHARAGAPDRLALVWLGGFRSDMSGSKAVALETWAARNNRGFLRFDYFGHGASSGRFEDATIGLWREDALAALDALIAGPVILVGSSMGAWIALHAALDRPERVAGLILIAPATDFTERLLKPKLSQMQLNELARAGRLKLAADFGDPLILTRAFLEEGRHHNLLDAPSIAIDAPVRILQGVCDDDVPPAHAVELLDRLESADVELTLVKDGDHRLSTPADIERLTRTADALCARIEARRTR